MGTTVGIGNRVGGGNNFSWSSYWAQLISAIITQADQDAIVLTFPSAKSLVVTDFSITVNGVIRNLNSATWDGAALTLVASSDFAYGDVVIVTFEKTGETTTATNNITHPLIIEDGDSVAWFDFLDTSTLTKDGSELVAQASSKIGSNHLLQADDAKKPTYTTSGLLFTPSNSKFMKCNAFTWDQPETIYMVFQQIATGTSRWIFDGNTLNVLQFQQISSAGLNSTVRFYAGRALATTNLLPLNTWCIATIQANGANSFEKINYYDAITGDAGESNAAGFTLGGKGSDGTSGAIIQVKEIILRKAADDLSERNIIFEYLAAKHSIPNNIFDKGKIIFSFDDGYDDSYTNLYPVLLDKDVKSTLFIPGEPIGTAGFVTWVQAKEMSDNGVDIQCHEWDYPPHTDNRALTEAQLIEQFTLVNNAFAANSLPAPTVTAYQGGLYDAETIEVASRYRRMARRTNGTFVYTDNPPYEIYSVDLNLIDAADVTTARAFIDVVELRKNCITFFAHHVDADGATNMATLIDYAKSKDVDIINFKELATIMNP